MDESSEDYYIESGGTISSDSSDECEVISDGPGASRGGLKRSLPVIVEQYPIHVKKARKVLKWPKNAISMLLELRLIRHRHFEVGDQDSKNMAWESIAAALNPTISSTAHECYLLFESLLRKYTSLKMQDISTAQQWDHFDYFQELFSLSSKPPELYSEDTGFKAKAKSRKGRGHGQQKGFNELNGEAVVLSSQDSFISYESELALYHRYVIDIQAQCQERIKEMLQIVDDFKEFREKNVRLLYQILKKITRNSGSKSRADQLLVFANIIPVFSSSSSSVVPLIDSYLQESTSGQGNSNGLALFYSAFLTSVRLLLDSNWEEDMFYVKFLPEFDTDFMNFCDVAKEEALLSEFNFKGHLHICRTTVEKLIQIVGVHLKDVKYNKPLSVEKQTIFALWYLIHKETFEQMSIRFTVRLLDVGKVIRAFIKAVASDVNLIVWPEDDSEVVKIVKGFESQRNDAFPGVIGAIGAKYLTLHSDETFCLEIEDNEDFLFKDANQHIIVQAVANTNYVVTNVFISWLDSLDISNPHDDLSFRSFDSKKKITPKDAFFRSPIGSCIPWRISSASPATCSKLQSLPNNVHLVGDHTYPLLMSLMVPYNVKYDESPSQYLFDIHLHLSRSVIDLAFGRIMSRFRRLSCLDYELKAQTLDLIQTCVGLHNLCMNEGDDYAPIKISLPEIDNFEVEHDPLPIATIKRDELCEAFENENISYTYSSYTFKELT